MEKDLQKDLQRIDIAFENLSYIVPVPKQKGESNFINKSLFSQLIYYWILFACLFMINTIK